MAILCPQMEKHFGIHDRVQNIWHNWEEYSSKSYHSFAVYGKGVVFYLSLFTYSQKVLPRAGR